MVGDPSTNVTIGGRPAVVVDDDHICPEEDKGKVLPPCSPSVLVGNRPLAVIGSEVGGGDKIVSGDTSVVIGAYGSKISAVPEEKEPIEITVFGAGLYDAAGLPITPSNILKTVEDPKVKELYPGTRFIANDIHQMISHILYILDDSKSIQVLNIIDHAWGYYLQVGSDEITEYSVPTEEFARLQGKFAPDGVIYLHGCWAGISYGIARQISSATGVPVEASPNKQTGFTSGLDGRTISCTPDGVCEGVQVSDRVLRAVLLCTFSPVHELLKLVPKRRY